MNVHFVVKNSNEREAMRVPDPVVLAIMTTFNDRVVLYARFVSIFEAREFTRFAKAWYRGKSCPCKVWSWGEHITSGEYQIELLFDGDVSLESVDRATYKRNPPCSNRGVTRID